MLMSFQAGGTAPEVVESCSLTPRGGPGSELGGPPSTPAAQACLSRHSAGETRWRR